MHTADFVEINSFEEFSNRIGPQREPCGTPEDTRISEEKMSSFTNRIYISNIKLIKFKVMFGLINRICFHGNAPSYTNTSLFLPYYERTQQQQCHDTKYEYWL